MNKLTKSRLQKIIKEELQAFQAHRLKIKQRPTTVFLFESRRSLRPARKTSLNFLLEQHNRGLITDNALVATWERSIFYEADLLQEDIGEFVEKGWEKTKEIGSKIGSAVSGAIEKIKDWLRSALDGALKIMVQGQMLFDKGLDVLRGIWGRIQSWCSEHELMCKAAKILLIFVVVAGVMGLMQGEAEAAIRLPDGKIASQFDVDAATGFIHEIAKEAKGAGASTFDVVSMEGHAIDVLRKAHEAKEVIDLEALKGPGAELAKNGMTGIRALIEDAVANKDLETSEVIMKMAEFGRNLVLKITGTL